jgi:hypothetical protein
VNPPEEKTVDEALLDGLALEAATYLRHLGAPLERSAVIAELCRNGAAPADAAAALDHGVGSGALVELGETMLDAGIVRGWL